MTAMTRVTARDASRVGACAVAAFAAVLVGCRGTTDTPGGGADLQRDLDAAAASAAFAPPIRGTAPARFVSALELGASPAPSGPARATSPGRAQHTVTPVHARQTARPTVVVIRVREVEAATPAEVAAAPNVPETVASADAPASAGAGTYTPPTDVGPAPSTRSSSVGGESSRGGSSRGGSGWGAVGSILGVVIRGGMIGDADHCDRHDRRGRRVQSGYPGEMITGTFHGVIGGHSSGGVILPVGRVVGALTAVRE